MKQFIKRKIWQIKNVFRWLPIIWKQYDFDYRYSIDVFKFQLQKQAEFLESDKSFTVCAKDKAKRIRTIIKLMEKVYEDDYSMGYVDKLKELYGEDVLEVSFVETNDITFNDFSGKTEKLFSIRYKYETWDNANEIEKVKGQLIKESHNKQMRAHKILWSLIEKDIRGWWD